MAYKFIYYDNAVCQLMAMHDEKRNAQQIFQRDKEIHVVPVDSDKGECYVVICFFADRYLCTFVIDKEGFEVFKQHIDMGMSYKTIMCDILVRGAYSDILNFKTLQHVDSDFKEYIRKEFYDVN